jgi:zinc-binding alcohol dehydrogenase/oxidoreductase
MRAIVLNGPGLGGLTFAELPAPVPASGEVVVRLMAAALNHRDLWCCRGWRGDGRSAALGSDGAGVIERVGAGVADWKPGDAVIVNPSLNWPDDSPAPGKEFEILGLPSNGTFAERLCIDARQLARKPEHLGWHQAAALPLSGLTGFRALFSVGELRAGQVCVIVGIGGGTALQTMLLAKAAGAEVIVTSRDAAKRRRAFELGARLALDSAGPWAEQVLESTRGAGADIVIENIGRPSWPQSLASLARGGRLVVYGSTGGDVVESDLVPLFLNWRSIRGTTMGNAAEFHRMVKFISRHGITPVVDSIAPFEQGIAALEQLERGGQFGKLVLSFAA